jgi:hypothetical protein
MDNGELLYKLLAIVSPCQAQLPTVESPSDYDEIIAAIHAGDTLQKKISPLPTRFKDIIGTIILPQDDGEGLLMALRSGRALLASDGSYMQHLQ